MPFPPAPLCCPKRMASCVAEHCGPIGGRYEPGAADVGAVAVGWAVGVARKEGVPAAGIEVDGGLGRPLLLKCVRRSSPAVRTPDTSTRTPSARANSPTRLLKRGC